MFLTSQEIKMFIIKCYDDLEGCEVQRRRLGRCSVLGTCACGCASVKPQNQPSHSSTSFSLYGNGVRLCEPHPGAVPFRCGAMGPGQSTRPCAVAGSSVGATFERCPVLVFPYWPQSKGPADAFCINPGSGLGFGSQTSPAQPLGSVVVTGK